MRRTGIAISSLLLAAIFARADWPQFLGPRGDAICRQDVSLARSWPKEGPKLLWKFPLEEGFANAAVAGDDLYIMDRIGHQTDVVYHLDLKTGQKKNEFRYEAGGRMSYPGARCTPAVDDKHVYTVGPKGDMHALSRKTFKPVWTIHLAKDFDGKEPFWGYGSSPVLHKDWLLLSPQTGKAGVIAVNRDSGKIAWKSPSLGDAAHSTPRVVTLDGAEQILMVSRKDLHGLDANSGESLWTFTGFTCRRPIPAPVKVGDDRLLFIGGYGMGGYSLRVSRGSDGWQVRQLDYNQELTSQTATPVVHDGHVYFASNYRRMEHGLVCVTPDGKIKWRTGKSPNFGYGNYAIADGLMVIVDAEENDLVLVEPTPKGYRELARFENSIKGKTPWGPVVVVDGKLLLRDQESLRCFDLRAKK
ncbi:MAG: PQQ-binding-like beta-propeller repeat protein [Phycisphaerae bacterium]